MSQPENPTRSSIPGVPGALYRLDTKSGLCGVLLAPIKNGKAVNDRHALPIYGKDEICVMFVRPTLRHERPDLDHTYQFNWLVMHDNSVWATTSCYFERAL